MGYVRFTHRKMRYAQWDAMKAGTAPKAWSYRAKVEQMLKQGLIKQEEFDRIAKHEGWE